MVFAEMTTAGMELLEEIGRYLDLVDAIRATGHEPTWSPERRPADDCHSERRTATTAGRAAAPRPRRFTV